MFTPAPEEEMVERYLFDSDNFARKRTQRPGTVWRDALMLSFLTVTMAYIIYLAMYSEVGIWWKVLILVILSIMMFMFSTGSWQRRQERIGSHPFRIGLEGVFISASSKDIKGGELTFVPFGNIVSIWFLRMSEETKPSAFKIFTKDGKRIFSGIRTRREMRESIRVFRELVPDICRTKNAFVGKALPDGPLIMTVDSRPDTAPSGSPLFDSAQYEVFGDIRKETNLISKSMVSLSIVILVLLIATFTISDATWFLLTLLVVTVLSIVLLLLLKMYSSRRFENVQLRLEVFQNGIRVNVGFWDVVKDRRRFIPMRQVKRVGFLAPTDDAVPKGCAFELKDGREIFPGWKNEAEMKALKRTMEELLPGRITWIEHRKPRLDDFF
jgi:Ca2+/Na+ antiporter